jgi:hypothetical protein
MGTLLPRTPSCVYSERTLNYSNGWTAAQKWLMGHEFVDAFIASRVLTPFPGTTSLRPQQFKVNPSNDGEVAVLADGSADWEIVTVEFALDFLDTPWPSNIPRPTYPAGTTLKLQAKASGQFLLLPAEAVKPDEIDDRPMLRVNGVEVVNPDYNKALAGAGNQNPQKARVFIPLVDFELEWDRIPAGTPLTYNGLIGKTNDASFMGAEAGVLLLEGPKLDPSYTLNTSNPWAHKITLTLKARRIVIGENIYGWNHDYVTGKGWQKQTMEDGAGGKVLRYPGTSFDSLLTFG